jgi:dephospho-CoA kinase
VLVDADQLARQVVEPDGIAYEAVVRRFGREIVDDHGEVDRPALAAIVFADPAARSDLERIVWPAVRQAMGARLAEEASTDHVVLLDIPLLAESAQVPEGQVPEGQVREGRVPEGQKSASGRDAPRPDLGLAGVIVVDCPVEVAVARLVRERGMDEADARSRVAAQASRETRLALADFVIDNSGDRAQLAAEVARAWAWIEALADRRAS